MKKIIVIVLLTGLLASPLISYDAPRPDEVVRILNIFKDAIKDKKKVEQPKPEPKKEKEIILTEKQLKELIAKAFQDGKKEGYKEGLKEGLKEGMKNDMPINK